MVLNLLSLRISFASHTYVNFPMLQDNDFAELLCLAEIRVPMLYVFVGHRYLQRGECGWHGSLPLRYQTCLIPARYGLKYAVILAYKVSLAVRQKAVGHSDNEERELGAGGTNNGDKSDKTKSRNEGSTAGGTDIAEAQNSKSKLLAYLSTS